MSEKFQKGQNLEEPVLGRLKRHYGKLTRLEQKLADTIIEHYAVCGLKSISELSALAGVSMPTTVRMTQKIGFSGYSEFQANLKQELEQNLSTPITRHELWSHDVPGTHLLNRFADQIEHNLRQTLSRLSPQEFDRAVSLVTDPKRHIYVVGGRLTRPLSEYCFTLLQMLRDNLTLITSSSNSWPHYVLPMQKNDVVIVFDIRRYERETQRLVQKAREKQLDIILFTDHWKSPIHKHASCCFGAYTQAPSAWDSTVCINFLVEALVSAVQNENWHATRDRINQLEKLFDETRLFHKNIDTD